MKRLLLIGLLLLPTAAQAQEWGPWPLPPEPRPRDHGYGWRAPPPPPPGRYGPQFEPCIRYGDCTEQPAPRFRVPRSPRYEDDEDY